MTCLTGVVGIALALAGADVVLTDLPHITPLTQQNVDANCRHTVHRAQVCGRFANRLMLLVGRSAPCTRRKQKRVSCCGQEVRIEGKSATSLCGFPCWLPAAAHDMCRSLTLSGVRTRQRWVADRIS